MASRVFSLPVPVVGLAFLVGYVALDWMTFIEPFLPFGITPWNPPPGLGFVLILLFGQRFLPLLFLAPLLADLVLRGLPMPWPAEIVTVAVTGAGYALGAHVLLRPETRFNPALLSMRDLAWLLGVAAVSAAAVSIAYVGALVLFGLMPAADFAVAAVQFWGGDAIGIAVVAPAALIFLTRSRRFVAGVETMAQLIAVLAALGVVFAYARQGHFQLFYILFLPIVWMAVRGGLGVVTIGILVAQIGLVLGITFYLPGDINVAMFQALMLVLALTGLAAGALVDEHRSTEMQLRLHQESQARLARLGSVGELAAAIAHEINQPLTAAGTYSRLVAEGLRQGSSPDPDLADTAGKAAAQVARAGEVVRRLRALIRLDQAGRAPVAVERIVKASLDLSRLELDRHNVATDVRIDADLPPVMADILQIEQVLLNLLRNSIEAIDHSGRTSGIVSIAASRAETGEVELKVKDNGPGFPDGFADLPLLTSSKDDGLGIGLSLCRSIVEAHGGRFFLGGGPGGAEVRILLPAAGAHG
ncbi:MAG: two-component sensor histidine kinase [Alphaproteobacteria bacterium]|nr:two-component sensor histidine kinase [Alphaproteobacteria bacterium]